MNSSHYQHLLKLYDCAVLLLWLENEDDEKEDELRHHVLRVISDNPELNHLKSYLLETNQEPITKCGMINKIIETLCQDKSVKFDTTLGSLCTTFRRLLVTKFALTMSTYSD